MKQSVINSAIADATVVFDRHGWALPPEPRWDVTGFGLEDFDRYGLTLLNLCELPEYCEKVMYEKRGQETPIHKHNKKQEDIICRTGTLAVQLFAQGAKGECLPEGGTIDVRVDGKPRSLVGSEYLYLNAGQRVTLYTGAYHRFFPVSEYCIISEVSTQNDDHHDNIWDNPAIKRFDSIECDAAPLAQTIA